jgi:hypothetical protein
MRERAEAASEGPWWVDFGGEYGSRFALITGILREPYGDNGLNCGQDHDTAQHIAGMHPGVALAVAAWLDTVADHWTPGAELLPVYSEALAVADAYLGGVS